MLFSYRTFSIPHSVVDPVVAGLTFTPSAQGVTVDADVSGEQTGDCIASVPAKTVANAREELLAAAGIGCLAASIGGGNRRRPGGLVAPCRVRTC